VVLEGAFLRSLRFRMTGFQHLVREKSFTLFMLPSWNSISVTFLMMRSVHLGFLARILVSLNYSTLCLFRLLYSSFVLVFPSVPSHSLSLFFLCLAPFLLGPFQGSSSCASQSTFTFFLLYALFKALFSHAFC